MRVVIDVVAGPLKGRKFHLVRNQRMKVGSTSRADLCIREDSALAPQHFALETDLQICRVRDLSGQGTNVNGQPVELAVLRSGDQVQAGNSRFIIHVEGDEPKPAPEILVTKPAKVAPPKRSATANYQLDTCDTGLTRYEGVCAQFPPAELAAALAADSPLVLLADNRRLQDAALQKIATPHYLFDWLGESAAEISPLIVLPGDMPDAPSLVGRGWGRDGVIAFFSKDAPDAAEKALRSSVRTEANQVVGICWPKILAYLLSHFQPDFVNRLMTAFACVLLESPTAADRWQLYAAGALDERLQAIGLKPTNTEK